MPIPRSGWGLTPGALEANATRSLGGKYGAIGNLPGALSDMTRQKYASGLEAKKAQEGFDLAKTLEANRKMESERSFGLDTERLSLEKLLGEQAYGLKQREMSLSELQEQRRLEDSLRQYGIQEEEFGFDKEKWGDTMSQEDRDASLRELQAQQQNSQFTSQLGSNEARYAAELKFKEDQARQQALEFAKELGFKEDQAAELASQWTKTYNENNKRYDQTQTAQPSTTAYGSSLAPRGGTDSGRFQYRTSPGGARYMVDTLTGKVSSL